MGRPLSSQSEVLAALRTIAPATGLDLQEVSDKFLMGIISRSTNRFLICQAYRGDALALRRLRVRIEKARLEARFWAYLKKYLQFEAAKRARRARINREHELLTLNEPMSDGTEEERLDFIPEENGPESSLGLLDDPREISADLRLSRRLMSLSDRQWKTLYLSAIKGYPEVQIARTFGVSQQAVSKAKLSALRQLRGGDT